MKLEVELVPSSSWFQNVRSEVSKSEWEKCKRYSKTKTNACCYLCGQSGLDQGWRWPTEAHEIWHYDDGSHIQTLIDIVPLCPMCHKTKHLGHTRMASDPKMWARIIEHLMTVNQMDPHAVEPYLTNAFEVWRERSQHEWVLNLYMLELILNNEA